MLSLNLAPIFKARGIEKPYSFLVKAGLSPHSATLLINSQPRIFRLDHVELLCTLLTCEPNDLLLYTPQNDQPIPPNHPLNNLRQQLISDSLQQAIATMPFKQLKEISNNISTQIQNPNQQ